MKNSSKKKCAFLWLYPKNQRLDPPIEGFDFVLRRVLI